jgi:mono/diheme cytochrome c family protein
LTLSGLLSLRVVAGLVGLLFLFPGNAFSEEKDGRSLFEHYCAVCHGKSGKGNGVNSEYLDPSPADLTDAEIVDRSDEELYKVIELGGAGVDLAPTMPTWGHTLSADQIKLLVSYVRALQKAPPHPKGVRLSDIKAGEGQCPVCHVKKGSHQIAPDLSHEGSKFNRDWLVQFLKNPARVRPVGYIPLTKTRMPNFNFTDEEASAVTAYLMTLKEDRFSSARVSGLDRSDAAVEEGKALFSDIYGCDGCHKGSEKGEGGIVGPHLSMAAGRLQPEWIYAWLKNPQSIRPDAPMPNFALPEQDIRYLMAYILSLGKEGMAAQSSASPALIDKGKGLVEKKNCLFCHILNVKEVGANSELVAPKVASTQDVKK